MVEHEISLLKIEENRAGGNAADGRVEVIDFSPDAARGYNDPQRHQNGTIENRPASPRSRHSATTRSRSASRRRIPRDGWEEEIRKLNRGSNV